MPPAVEFSWTILLTLLLIFFGASAVFFTLIRRFTTQRRWSAMQQWARDHGFRHRGTDWPLPPALAISDLPPQLILASGTTAFVDFTPSRSDHPIHVMHRAIDVSITPAGLRPVNDKLSYLDRFRLSAFPLMTENDRFLAVGADSAAARQVVELARRLLPGDLGLLFHGPAMVIDFSNRPFDTIEFDRLVALSDQLLLQVFKPEKK